MKTDFKEMLTATYGPFMDAKALCKVLCFPSVAALQAAKARGRLPFRPVPLEGRRGLFALTEEIAEIVQRSVDARPPRAGAVECRAAGITTACI